MSPTGSLEIFAEEVSDRAGGAAVGLKLQHSNYEINLLIAYDEIQKLSALSNWEPGAVQIGSAAGAAAFWSNDSGNVSIFVGTDDENWDFGVWISEAELLEIIDQVEQVSGGDDPYNNLSDI